MNQIKELELQLEAARKMYFSLPGMFKHGPYGMDVLKDIVRMEKKIKRLRTENE